MIYVLSNFEWKNSMNKKSLKQRYLRLLKARNYFIFQLVVSPGLIWLVYMVLNYVLPRHNAASVLSMLIGLVIYLFIAFGFFMQDLCPWCKQTFFSQTGTLSKIIHFDVIIRKKCTHCQQPENPESFLK